jgi:hypothetical protein
MAAHGDYKFVVAASFVLAIAAHFIAEIAMPPTGACKEKTQPCGCYFPGPFGDPVWTDTIAKILLLSWR